MAPVSAPGFWRGQLYILDPTAHADPELRLRFLRTLVDQLVPAFLNLDLLRRLRVRAETFERQRISRELHDGPLQSLAALDMRLHVLGTRAGQVAPDLVPELTELRELLHEEALELRELMERLRSARADAPGLQDALSGLVERFGRSRGVDARLDWSVGQLDLSPHQCGQVIRIIQEALVNARRYRGATRITARVEADASAWGLIVEDNGGGLGPNAVLGGEPKHALRNGTRVIAQRVAGMGGTLDVRSTNAGTRIEMSFAWPGQA
jgi:signal transduction histidine kinase